MRFTILAILLVASVAHAESKRPLATLVKIDPPKARTLEASEVKDHVRPLDEQIGRCYLDAAGETRGAGHLEIKLSIHRTGTVEAVEVSTPKLPTRTAKQIDGCVKALVSELTFPARRSPTTAVIPYFYQRTAAPNAGPQLSCWDPKGCH